MNSIESIEGCYKKMYLGMVNKDRSILSKVLDDSFVLVHMTGMRQKKDSFLSAVESGVLNYYSAEHQHIDAALYGDTAQLVGQSIVDAAVFGGGRHTWQLQLKLKLIFQNGTWKITEAIASTY